MTIIECISPFEYSFGNFFFILRSLYFHILRQTYMHISLPRKYYRHVYNLPQFRNAENLL